MEAFLRELLDLLQYQTGESPDDFFNRRFQRISETRSTIPDWQPVKVSNLIVVEQHWTLGQLLIFPLWHHKARPVRTDVPVVIFRGWGHCCLIDGQSRVNRWRETIDEGPHRVLLASPRSSLSYASCRPRESKQEQSQQIEETEALQAVFAQPFVCTASRPK
jgi:hypothetical protein